jgi:hypothetical protein
MSATAAAAAPGASARNATLTLLLAPRATLQGGGAPQLSRLLARGDCDAVAPGDEAQLQRHFDILPRGMPVAALTRQFDCGDATLQAWLRADPAHVRADLGSGRMLACGDLGLSRQEAEQLIAPLRPLFGDDGCPISIGSESRWYLSLPRDAKLPAFAPPADVLGDDIYEHLPAGDAGRRWRRLLSEAQVMLHNHPVNEARARAGKLTANTLWFWGGGPLPDHVRCAAERSCSDDLLFAALALRADLPRIDLPPTFAGVGRAGGTLLDLRRVRSTASLEKDWIEPALTAQRAGDLHELLLDFADGTRCRYQRGHRWRFWRRAPATLA